MNTNTRYILTATAVAGGLFFVGATANAIVGGVNSAAAGDQIGDPVVLPSASDSGSSTPDASTAPEPAPSPSTETIDDPVVNIADDSGSVGAEWQPGAGSGSGSFDDDDDDHEDADHDDDDHKSGGHDDDDDDDHEHEEDDD